MYNSSEIETAVPTDPAIPEQEVSILKKIMVITFVLVLLIAALQ